MAEFISSFTTGFSDVVAKNLPQIVHGIKILNIYDGLVHYKYDGNSRDLEKVIYFNNTFFVLKVLKGQNLNFKQLVNSVVNAKSYFLINKGTFRVRFVQENQFAKVDKAVTRRVEEFVVRNSKLSVDRLSPQTEVWFNIRREGFAFCGQLISKREFTEKNLNKGELRPEVAYLMCAFGGLSEMEQFNAADPFAGYGSIPVQLIKNFRVNQLFVSDIEKNQIDIISQKKQMNNEKIVLCKADAFELTHISDKSLDVVITDPPWGYYEDIGDITVFYDKMFASFRRILKADGFMVILSARKENLEMAAEKAGVKILDSLHTLVNGKKASLYKLAF